jgi:CheY-like chemotaxis protein
MDDEVDCHPVHVYVADNEKIITSTLTRILAQNGYISIGFTHPLDALQSATAHPPDLLIADVIMLEMNGIELAIEFHARFPRCKVLLLSWQAVTTDLLENARQRGHDFTILAKPIHPKDLLAAIGNFTAS